LTRPHSASRRDRAFRCPYTGLRIGEALGLTWADIDHEAGLIRVHRKLSRQREHAPLKTEAGKREVILASALGKALRERWLASR
jgi:integrase